MKPESGIPELGLLVIGDEILSGRRPDQHLAKLVGLLTERGLVLDWARYVGDGAGRITAVLREVFQSGGVVFSTGGIGATPDDRTRQCAAEALGVPLALHPEAKRLIQLRGQQQAREKGESWEPGRADNLQRLKMGEFPQGAHLIPNPYNGIPGFYCTGAGGGRVYFTPGFPVMAWPMMEWALQREGLDGRLGPTWRERSVLVFGTAESVLTPFMERVEADHPGVHIFSLPSVDDPTWGAHIDLGVKGPPELVEPAFADLLERLAPLRLRYGPERTRPPQ